MPPQNSNAIRNWLLSVALGLPLFLALNLPAQSLEEIKAKELETRTQMRHISKELGVTCTACHLIKNYRDNSKKAFKVAQDHMRAVALLREQGFDGRKYSEANCFFCHRGNLKPQMTPPKELGDAPDNAIHLPKEEIQ